MFCSMSVRCSVPLDNTPLIRYGPIKVGENFSWIFSCTEECIFKKVGLLQNILGAPFRCIHEPYFVDKAI